MYLRHYFKKFGEIHKIRIIKGKKQPNKPKTNCGLVTFKTYKAAKK